MHIIMVCTVSVFMCIFATTVTHNAHHNGNYSIRSMSSILSPHLCRCVRSGLGSEMRTGLRSVSNLAASWTADVAEADKCVLQQQQQKQQQQCVQPQQQQEQQQTHQPAQQLPSAAPKMLADLLEAVLGAVLLDSDAGGGQGLAMVWHVYCSIALTAGMSIY